MSYAAEIRQKSLRWVGQMRDFPFDRDNIFHRDAAQDLRDAERVLGVIERVYAEDMEMNPARLQSLFRDLADCRERFERHTRQSVA